jgi:hypothetical protein
VSSRENMAASSDGVLSRHLISARPCDPSSAYLPPRSQGNRPRLLVPGGGGTLVEIGGEQPTCSPRPVAAHSPGSINQLSNCDQSC